MINILETNKFVVYNEVPKNESIQMLGLKKLQCKYCNKYFFKHWRDIKIDNIITCPHCGKNHINKFKVGAQVGDGIFVINIGDIEKLNLNNEELDMSSFSNITLKVLQSHINKFIQRLLYLFFV